MAEESDFVYNKTISFSTYMMPGLLIVIEQVQLSLYVTSEALA